MDGARSSVGRWSYAGIAAFLGILWWGALFAHPEGRQLLFMLDDSWLYFLVFPATSVLLAVPFRFLFGACGVPVSILVAMALAEIGSFLLPILYLGASNLTEGTIHIADGWDWAGAALFGGALGLRIAFDLWPVTLPVAIVSGLLLRWAARIRMADSHGEPIGVH